MNIWVPTELKKKIKMIALRDGTSLTIIMVGLMQRYIKEDEEAIGKQTN